MGLGVRPPKAERTPATPKRRSPPVCNDPCYTKPSSIPRDEPAECLKRLCSTLCPQIRPTPLDSIPIGAHVKACGQPTPRGLVRCSALAVEQSFIGFERCASGARSDAGRARCFQPLAFATTFQWNASGCSASRAPPRAGGGTLRVRWAVTARSGSPARGRRQANNRRTSCRSPPPHLCQCR